MTGVHSGPEGRSGAGRPRGRGRQDEPRSRPNLAVVLLLGVLLLLTTVTVATLQQLGPEPSEGGDGLTVVAAPTRGRCLAQPGTLEEGVRHVNVRVESSTATVRIFTESGELTYSSTPASTASSRVEPRQVMARFTVGRYKVECRIGDTRLTSPLAVVGDD